MWNAENAARRVGASGARAWVVAVRRDGHVVAWRGSERRRLSGEWAQYRIEAARDLRDAVRQAEALHAEVS